MKKILFIYLTIVMAFIVSCNNKSMNPTDNSGSGDEITYYDPANAETAKFNIIVMTESNPNGALEKDVEFKKIAESGNAIIYIQSSQSFDMNNVKALFTKFEENYDEELRIYGEPISFPNINNDKMVFLIYDFYPGSSGNFAGFLNPYDLYDNHEETINKGKYMYINISQIKEPDYIVGTMFHEFQHLINASVNMIKGEKAMDLWLNEALSESTSVLFAHSTADNRKDIFNAFPYYSFYSWKIDEIMGNIQIEVEGATHLLPSIYFSYCSSSVFMRWIEHIGGRETIRTIAHSSPSLDTGTRLVNSVQGLNIGNSVDAIFISWMKDVYNGNLPGVKVFPMTFKANNPLITSDGLALAPGGFIIYNKSEYNLNNPAIKEEALDSANNMYLAWNPKFDSVDVIGIVNSADIIWVKATSLSPASSLSKTEMFKFDYSKLNRMSIDKVLTAEEVIRAKSKK